MTMRILSQIASLKKKKKKKKKKKPNFWQHDRSARGILIDET